MKLILIKIIVVLLCLPAYPLVLFAEWYDKSTHFGPKFNLRRASKEYWIDVWDALAYKKETDK